jgi:hypothetical protein
MKTLISCFIISSSFLLALNLCAQEMEYVIDPSLDMGTFYSRGGIHQTLIHGNGNMLTSGSFFSASGAGTRTLLNYNGAVIFNNGVGSTLGPTKVYHYKDKYVSCGIQILQAFNSNGTDYSFNFEFQKSAYNGFLGNDVMDAIVEPDDHILAAGRFFTDSTNIAPETIRQLCRVDSTGAPDPAFPMLHCAEPMDAYINDLDTLSDGSFIISGHFYEFGGYIYNHVGKLKPDFSVDTTFTNSFGQGDLAVTEFVDSQDRIWLTLFDVDVYADENSPAISGMRFVRLFADGSIDPSFSMPQFINTYVPGQISGVNDMIELPDGRFIIVGDFDGINGQARKKIALIEDDGAVVEGIFEDYGADEATWGTWTSEFGPALSSIELLSDGKLLIAGGFSSFGGQPYSCIVRLQPQPVSTQDVVQKESLHIFPNPAEGSFTITRPNGDVSGQLDVEIYDLTGRLVFASAGHYSEAPIYIEGLATGVYVVRAESTDAVYSGRLLVE